MERGGRQRQNPAKKANSGCRQTTKKYKPTVGGIDADFDTKNAGRDVPGKERKK